MSTKTIIEISPEQLADKTQLLRQLSEPVTEFNEQLRDLVEDLKDTLFASNLAVGLSAPQIGVLKRVAIINIARDRFKPTTVLINPKVDSTSKTFVVKPESCMSIPHFQGDVERPDELVIHHEDIDGKEKRLTAKGFFARVILHEIDHLNGVLYTDLMKPGTSLQEVDFFRKAREDKGME